MESNRFEYYIFSNIGSIVKDISVLMRMVFRLKTLCFIEDKPVTSVAWNIYFTYPRNLYAVTDYRRVIPFQKQSFLESFDREDKIFANPFIHNFVMKLYQRKNKLVCSLFQYHSH